MNTIGPTSQLIAIIRQHINAAPDIARKRNQASNNSGKSPNKSASQTLYELAAKKIKLIDADDPHRHEQAFKYFLEGVLLAEFGEEMINDPSFYQMSDRVFQAMKEDPSISVQIKQAGKILFELNASQIK